MSACPIAVVYVSSEVNPVDGFDGVGNVGLIGVDGVGSVGLIGVDGVDGVGNVGLDGADGFDGDDVILTTV